MKLEQQRERIQDDLRGLVCGEVRADEVFLQLYATDASIYEIRPLCVVRPVSTADVAACVQYAAEKGIPVHARGAGTGTAGESLGPGLVVDFSRHLHRVKYVGAETVRVQPGVSYQRLNEHLRRLGRLFGPDPPNSPASTLGGVIALDGAGSHWLKYGSPRRHIVSLQVVLADGTVLTLGREPLQNGSSADANPRKRELITRVVRLLAESGALLGQHGSASPVDRCGYHLADVLGDGFVDLPKLLAGSEGTLALFTEAVLATQPLPAHRGVALLLFDSLEKASRSALELLAHQPSACDLMDRRHLSLARETEVRFDLLVPPEAEAALLVEMDGDQPWEVRDRLHELVDQVHGSPQGAFAARQAFDPAEVDLFWQLARKITPTLYRLKGPARPVPVVEDLAVPPEVLPDFLVRMQNVLKWHQVTAAMFCHAGQGQVHLQPFLNLRAAEDIQKMQHLAEDLYQEVFDLGGTISAEHGCGLSRTPFVRRQCGPLFELFRKIKQVFDPQNILNPGKVVAEGSPSITANLRPAVWPLAPMAETQQPEDRPAMRRLIELQLSWDPVQLIDVVRACNGCGECRSEASGGRMCPIFRMMPSEEASPRAKANLIRGVLAGRMELGSLTSEEFKAVADLCVNCHMCWLECPARVDVPKLMLEGKGAYAAAKALRFSDWAMSRLDWWAPLAARVAPLVNWALRSRQMRWLLEKTLGIAQGRKLPRIARRSYLRRAARRRLTRPARRAGHKVALFVDLYANYFDPELAQALVAVMEHNGVSVYVPPDQKQAGVPAICFGALEIARRLAAHNVAVLAEAVRQGYHVVTPEPAAALCLVREYPNLIDDEDARLVARNTSEACSYLWKMHTLGRLQLDFRPIQASLGYHMPCRLKALNVGSPGENLLRLIPGLIVYPIEEGCSGMAGTFGLLRRNYRASLRAGWGLITRLRSPAIQAGTTECSACKIQMEQGTDKPTIHPLKLLALAYGLMPQVADLLSSPATELLVR
ncbi:MAG: FAD-binding and (Fe-S)-binding domain-containing protein [Thermoguttaceae bacterium]